MDKRPMVSLCIPTNGVSEWVFPVLESIYKQKIDSNLYEVVITDNGKDRDFKEKIKEYLLSHTNIVYAETQALPFINEIESYRRANGKLIKFVNHRTLLVDGALQKFISLSESKERPIIYYANGVLDIKKLQHEYDSFDLFVRNLSYWSSWSTGMTIWKDDFNKLENSVSSFNELFPHTNVLFAERNREKYIIDNTVIFNEIPQGRKPKGDYDLFNAFGIEYPGVICDLLRDGDITNETFRYVLDKNLELISALYFEYVIRKNYCSYSLKGLDRIFGVFYTKNRFKQKVIKHIIRCAKKKVLRK